MVNYTGKNVFLGIDVHKKTYSVTTICEKSVVKKATMKADPQGLINFCNKYFPGAQVFSAYEAGFSGFHLHRILTRHGIKNIVIHAAGIESAINNRAKTDVRDSQKIASLLADGRLRGIRVPNEEREDKRALTRVRESMVRHRTTVANQIKSFVHAHGLMSSIAIPKISFKWLENLKKVPMSDGIRYALEIHIDLWIDLTKKIDEINNKIAEQAEEDNSLEEVFRSAPGIGPVGARVLANELEDMVYFNNERQLFSYIGLTPSEYSSGEHIRKGHISRQGKPVLRKILVQAAWKAIKVDSYLKEVFERIAIKAGKKKAIVAIARRLIGHIRACFKKQMCTN